MLIRGATLAGMACAARLAKLGHPVTLVTDGAEPGGPWVTDLPPIVTLPATWRDLFKKSGRAFDAEMTRAGLALVEAGGTTHRFSDGTEFTLPAERGQQFRAIDGRYGAAAAESWRDTLDDLDDAWLAARRFGVERPDQPRTPEQRAHLWLNRTLADVADRVGHPNLAAVILSLGPRSGTDSRRAPALLATRLVVERTFGRWQVVDDQDHPLPATRLIGLLAGRLATRRVQLVERDDGPTTVDCRPVRPALARAALAPAVGHSRGTDAGGGGVTETVDHTSARPVVTWAVPGPGGSRLLTWDYAHRRRDLAWGLEPRSARALLRRPAVLGDPLRASACSPAGPEPWAELASAALAAYEAHERATGEDTRPTNRENRTRPTPKSDQSP